jgi:hypothetical protein
MELERFFLLHARWFSRIQFSSTWRCHLLFSDLNIPHQRHKIVFKLSIVAYTTI